MSKENYLISFEEAKAMDIYSFDFDTPTKEGKVGEKYNIKKIKELSTTYDSEDREMLAVLQFGNIDIELEVERPVGRDTILSYFCCAKHVVPEHLKERWNGWESDNYAKTIPVIDENLERHMFDSMMKYAEENNLTWSRLNS